MDHPTKTGARGGQWGPGRTTLVYLGLFALLASIMASPFLWGGYGFAYVDIGGDTYVQFYPLNVEIARQMAEGVGPSWSFRLGLGAYTATHFDPIWMIQGLLPESSQLQARIYVYLFKIGLGGLLFAFYAGMVGLRGMLGVLAGLAYAFSDYAVINAQWDLLHATEVYVFAALVLLLEAWCRDQRVAWALLIGVLLGLSHPFNLFTSAFFSLGYLAARTLVIRPGWSITEWARRLGILFAGVLAGVMVMAPICLPNLIQFLDSPRVMGDHSPLRVLLRQVISVNGGDILFSSAAGIFGKGILGVGNNFRGILNFLEAPGFYVGLPFLLLSTQLLSGNARTEERRLLWFAMAFIVAYMLFPAIRYAAFGFNHTGFRMSTLWCMMLIIVVGTVGFRRALVSGLDVRILVPTAGMLAAFALLIRYFQPGIIDAAHTGKVVAFVLLYTVLLLFLRRQRSLRPAVVFVVAAALVAEYIVLERPALVDRKLVKLDGSSAIGSYDDGSKEAIAWINSRHSPGDFFRVEKAYQSVFLLDSLVQGYRGIRSYYFHGTGVTRFMDMIGWPRPVPASNYIGADISRVDVLDLLAVRYVLSTGTLGLDRGFRYLETVRGINIYERPSARSVAVLHYRSFPESAALAREPVGRPGLMLEGVILDDSRAPLDPDIARDPVDVAVEVEGDWRLSGEFLAEDDAVLAFAIPFAPGWSLFLDGGGTELELERVNFGLTGARVPPGRHTFELVYRLPGRTAGWAVSPLAALLAALLLRTGRGARCGRDGRKVTSADQGV